jgi:hypothetical protein
MIKYRKISYFEKYLDAINEKNKFLQKHDYYIKIPLKYDVKYWLMAALKKKLFDDSQKVYFDLEGKEAEAGVIKKHKMEKGGKGGIIVFPNNISVIMRYLHEPLTVFKNRAVKKIFKKYSNGVLWNFGNRYRGIYYNEPRDTTFNSESDTLEILDLGSGDLINISVKIAVQLKQPILLIKDMNNEQMIILAKNLKDNSSIKKDESIYREELTNLDIKRLKWQLNDIYKLCDSDQHSLWEIHDIYPKLNDFWIEGKTWYGR